jgi:hypothetical protein
MTLHETDLKLNFRLGVKFIKAVHDLGDLRFRRKMAAGNAYTPKVPVYLLLMGWLHLTKSETRYYTDKTATYFFVTRPV